MVARRRRVSWTYCARQALDDAVAYVAADSPRRAAQLLIRVLDAASSLDQLSERGRNVPEVNDSNVRQLLVRPYRLIYELTDDSVFVLGLIHDRQEFFLRRT